MRGRFTDPVENLNCYVMVHGGVDRHERLEDVIWVRKIIEAAKEVDFQIDREGDAFHRSIDKLKEALK